MHQDYIDTRLSQLGFTGESRVRNFQLSQGLLTDGVVGVKTDRALSEWQNYFCGVTDRMGLSNRTGKWIKGEVSWGTQGGLPGFSTDELAGVYADAFAAWSRICGLKFRHAKGEPAADITITFGPIDQMSGTLAWSELPNGQQDRGLTQKYDVAEKFVNSVNPARGEIDLLRVASHEIGHAIGLSHITNSAGTALLNPMYNRNIRDPQPLDIAEAVKRYGTAKTGPSTPAPGTDEITLTVGGDRYRWQARKVI